MGAGDGVWEPVTAVRARSGRAEPAVKLGSPQLKITRLKITRREFALGSLALGTAVLALGGAFVRPALADDPPLADLMAPNPLGEMAIGDAKAPITVIEYAS